MSTSTNRTQAQEPAAKTKKKRPLLKVFLGVAAFFLLVCGGVVAKFVFILNRQPTISVDYVAKLNERAMAVPEDERAWPVYEPAMASLAQAYGTSSIECQDLVMWGRPGDSGWSEVRSFLGEHEAVLASIRGAASMECGGFIVDSVVTDVHPVVARRRSLGLANFRDVSQIFRAAFYDDISLQNGDGAVANLEAAAGLARHLDEQLSIISQLVRLDIYEKSWSDIREAVSESSGVLADGHLARIGALVENQFADGVAIRFDIYQYEIDDFLQRCFTDDGRGDGLFSPAGAAEFHGLIAADPVPESSLYLAAAFASTRAETQAVADAVYKSAQLLAGTPRHAWDIAEYDDASKSVGAMYPDLLSQILSDYFVAFDQLLLVSRRSALLCDATRIVVALERHRRKHGEWPATLEAIDPAILAEVPNDDFTGEPFIYRLLDGEPLLYSIGTNGVDDGGQHSRRAFIVRGKEEGDCVFFPPPADED